MGRKSVYIAHAGGTIGMQAGPDGYHTEPGCLQEQMASLPELSRHPMPEVTVNEYEPLLDSANMTPADWGRIGEDLVANYDRYDGFVVLHGTDTMAYSASALSFMLDYLAKPVVFTGSQIPLTELRNDARENLVTSLLIAANHPVPEVCLYFGEQLLRGNRATKVSSSGFRAFASPNFPNLGTVGVDINIDWQLAREARPGALRFTRVGGPHLANIHFFPGQSEETLEQFLAPPIEGAILHTYGSGNAPNQPGMTRVLREATDRGVVIVNCTQCLSGSVRMDSYATGHSLIDAGVLSGADMTPEAALTKLYFLLSSGLERSQIRRLMTQSLRGELTPEKISS